MSINSPNLRQQLKTLAAESLQRNEPSSWFEPLYRAANSDPEQVPWAKLTPHPQLQAWLATQSNRDDGPEALVIACGLGDDAEALAAKGYRVTAFDISPTAIAWCQKRFPASLVNYCVADVLALPQQWQGKFSLVFECRTIQALPLSVRSQVIAAIAKTVKVTGQLWVVTRLRPNDTESIDGPPWAVSEAELAPLKALNLREMQRSVFTEAKSAEITQAAILYQHQ